LGLGKFLILSPLYRRVYLAVNYRLRGFRGGRWAHWVRPTFIAMLLTRRCNARCVHCDIWKNTGPEERLSLSEWKALLGDLRRWLGPVDVLLTGGEPLLLAEAPEITAFASSQGLRVEFLTNGYWKDQRRLKRLAAAEPWRVTVSLDAAGPVHSTIRGREDFWDTVDRSLETLVGLRRNGARFEILLKTVIMRQNLGEVAGVARYARSKGIKVLYQPIEQNYNTPDDSRWFEHAPTWPRDAEEAAAVVDELAGLRQAGYPIINTPAQFEAMKRYFRDPASIAAEVQAHVAHEHQPSCGAISNLEIWPNGDVFTCAKMPAVGNVGREPIRAIWARRPRWWESGCCLRRS